MNLNKTKKQLQYKTNTKTRKMSEKKVSPTVLKNIKKIRSEGATVLLNFKEKTIQNILEASRKYYYNDEPIITDNEYDIIKEYMEKKYPKNKESTIIGADVKADKVKLPYFMGSMDKIKPDTNAIVRWIGKYKGPYVISTKLDGVSGLYSIDGDESRLYTRGNGKVGQDITKYIGKINMPTPKNIPNGTVVRGEFIIRQDIFKVYYGADFSNSRNFVSGVINSKSPSSQKLGHVDFVAYELIKPELKPSEQFKYLNDYGFIVARNEKKYDVSNGYLSELLVNWRKSYEYEIDGIICCDDNIYPRKEGNPDHAFAFKMILGEQIAEAKVLAVEWSPSKDGLLKPRIKMEPVVLGGAKIEYATAFNAEFVKKNKLGVGAKIKIIRSGDVIPYIMDVLEPAEQIMWPPVEYEWYGENQIDIVLKNKADSKLVKGKNIVFFFKTLEVDGVGPGNVEKIVTAGYDSIQKIVKMTVEDFLKIDGFKQKMSEKIHESIKKSLEDAELVDIMAASNMFGHGMGKKKMNVVLNEYPDVLISKESKEEKISKIKDIKSMADKSATLFVNHIDDFLEFLESIDLKNKLTVKKIKEEQLNYDVNHPLYQKSIVISGFRDSELTKKINESGGKESSTISKNTFVLVIKEGIENSKTEKAKNLGVKVMSQDDFKLKYFS